MELIGENYYKELSQHHLIQFYKEIKKKIDQSNIYSEAMYNELGLIREAARKKDILLPNFSETNSTN